MFTTESLPTLDPPISPDRVRRRLTGIIEHRHAIVHRADKRKITRDPVLDDIRFIGQVGDAIDAECEAV